MKLKTALLILAILGACAWTIGDAAGAPSADAGRGRLPDGLVPRDATQGGVLLGGPVGAGKAASDTIYLLGGPNRLDGKFQLADGVTPDRQGWVGVDLSAPPPSRWSVSTWNGRATLDPVFTPNHTMWCGEMLAPCPGGDPPQGYSNGYDEWLDWYGTVADRGKSTNVTVTCALNGDSEPDYDFLRFEVMRGSMWEELVSYSGVNTLVNFSQTFSMSTGDYVGPTLDQIHLRFRATSDSGWSDADCRWPTYGHSNLDNIQVTTDNGVTTSDNFEGEVSSWIPTSQTGCGDFSHVWPRLADIDPCHSDNTPAFAFIDDGQVVPGTGGSPGVTWTYGPGGYVVNVHGGLAGPGNHLNNEIWSPVLAWPGSQYGGMQFNFCVYRHLPLEPGVYYTWHVRASTDGGATWGGWQSSEFILYSSSASWYDSHNDVTTLIPPTRTHVQLGLGVLQYGWVWGYDNGDATPAPYFDNVRALAYSFPGPAISARDIDLFQDNFPANGAIDYANLGRNSVRLDMAANCSPRAHLRNDPGDSMIVRVAVVRTGATLQGAPKLFYKLEPNPLFDAFRTSGLPNEGFVAMDSTKTSAGSLIANSWRRDLPDSNFFFPGDVLHWYVEAQDNLAGDVGTTRLPPDTTGFSLFPNDPGYVPLRYPSTFIVRALPTLNSATPGDQPRILFWNDFANRGGENEWNGALAHLGYQEGADYDEYYTNGPTSGVGNGLGGRATAAQLAGYDLMLYTSGDLGNTTISNGDFKQDPGNDVAVLTSWLSQGGKKWFCTGDHLAYDLGKSGAAALAFRNSFLPMVFNSMGLRALIENQTSPTVVPVAGNPVGLTLSYVAQGGCGTANTFDAVQATTGSQRIATFQPVSSPEYPYAAALYVPNAGGFAGSAVVYMPYDLMHVRQAENLPEDHSYVGMRALVLQQVMTFFGQFGDFMGADDVPALSFSARTYPNPFNPSTKIEYTLPRDGQLTIRIYNVRGQLVRTLLDARAQATPKDFVTWSGDDDRGQAVASGVYFCQVKSDCGEIFNKVTLVK